MHRKVLTTTDLADTFTPSRDQSVQSPAELLDTAEKPDTEAFAVGFVDLPGDTVYMFDQRNAFKTVRISCA